jgi:hypothetical protein
LKGRKLEKCISFLGSIGPVFERTTHVVGDKLFLKLLRGIGVSEEEVEKSYSRTGNLGIVVFGLKREGNSLTIQDFFQGLKRKKKYQKGKSGGKSGSIPRSCCGPDLKKGE